LVPFGSFWPFGFYQKVKTNVVGFFVYLLVFTKGKNKKTFYQKVKKKFQKLAIFYSFHFFMNLIFFYLK